MHTLCFQQGHKSFALVHNLDDVLHTTQLAKPLQAQNRGFELGPQLGNLRLLGLLHHLCGGDVALAKRGTFLLASAQFMPRERCWRARPCMQQWVVPAWHTFACPLARCGHFLRAAAKQFRCRCKT